MSFTWKRPEGRITSPEDMMRLIIRVADELGMPDRRGACIIAGMTVKQESDFWRPGNHADPAFHADPSRFLHDSLGDDGRSVGPYQQQTSGPPPASQWGWGGLYGDPEGTRKRMDPYESTKLFLAALKREPYRAGNAQEANDWAQRVQKSGVPNGYFKHWDAINALYDSVTRGGAPPAPPAPPAAVLRYGLPPGTRITYGAPGFPQWVYDLGAKFNVRASTYAGHQETNRNEAGYAPNLAHLNRGIDWAGSVADMQRLADYLFSVRGELEQLIWENPETNRRLGVAGGKDVTTTAYFDYPGGYDDHRDHVHTRQSHAIPIPGGAPTPAPPAPPKQVGWKGDPVWLPDVLRAAGLVCNVYPGAFERGHGDMGQIWGVMAHHTGSFGETPRGIAEHPTLGLASQLYLSRNGEYTLCGVGKAWHGGTGSYPGISDVNGQLIGIEAANDGGGTPGKPHRSSWSDAQYDAYVRGVAAILGKLGFGADRVIGHKEWAGKSQGKWDPGAIDMNIFRADVSARLIANPDSGDIFMALSDAEQREMLDYLRWMARPDTGELRKQFPSRSCVRTPNEGLVDTAVGMGLNTDGNVDFLATFLRAQLKYPPAIERLKAVATNTDPERRNDALLAQAMLAEAPKFTAPKAAVTVASTSSPAAAPAVPAVVDTRELTALHEENARLREEIARLQTLVAAQPAPSAEVALPTEPISLGAKVGRFVDAVGELGLADAADIQERATLSASIKVLATKNGSEL